MKYKIYIAKALDFLKRNGSNIAIGIFAIYLLGFESALIKTLLMIVTYESLAIALSGFALFAYTKVNFTNALMQGEDGESNSIEQHSTMRLFGSVFIGVHTLIGLIVLGTYLANIDSNSIKLLGL